YEQYGVEECYVFDPDTNVLEPFVRGKMGAALVPKHFQGVFVSPRLGIRFDLTDKARDMAVFFPDGKPFRPGEEHEQRAGIAEKDAADQKERADKAAKDAADQKERADKAAKDAADQKERADRLAELGRKARRGLASPEE